MLIGLYTNRPYCTKMCRFFWVLYLFYVIVHWTFLSRVICILFITHLNMRLLLCACVFLFFIQFTSKILSMDNLKRRKLSFLINFFLFQIISVINMVLSMNKQTKTMNESKTHTCTHTTTKFIYILVISSIRTDLNDSMVVEKFYVEKSVVKSRN